MVVEVVAEGRRSSGARMLAAVPLVVVLGKLDSGLEVWHWDLCSNLRQT